MVSCDVAGGIDSRMQIAKRVRSKEADFEGVTDALRGTRES